MKNNLEERFIELRNENSKYSIKILELEQELQKTREQLKLSQKLVGELDAFCLHIKSEITRASDVNYNCIGCIGCTDLPESELCHCCWHIKVNGKKYPLWDTDSTYSKLPDIYKDKQGE